MLRNVLKEFSNAAKVRDQLFHYFLTRGRVPWQEKKDTQGYF